MEILTQIYARYVASSRCSDKGTVHSYIEVYEELLAPYRESAKRVLEIGIFAGYSMLLWEEYFVSAEVHGIDLCDQPHDGLADLRPMLADGTHRIAFLNAADPEAVENAFSGQMFDVIIDDANHNFDDQLRIYDNFKTHLSPGGLYVIEDIADIDQHRAAFEALSPTARVIDRRRVKDRFDDVLVVL